MPAMREVARGRGTVLVQGFNGNGQSAGELKAALKLANPKLSAKALSSKVNETLRGERSVREQLGIAWVQACYQDGLVPSHGERTHNGACLRMKAAPEPQKAEAPAPAIPETKEGLESMLKELQAKLAAMTK